MAEYIHMEKFVKRIKALRQDRGMTQVEFAKAINVAGATVAHWECGGRMPSINMLVRIADFYNVTTDFLLGRIDY